MSLADLSKGVYSTAEALSNRLEEPLEPNGLIELANQAIQLSEKLWEEIKNRPIADMDDIACKNGCSWCCYKQVEVSPLEVFAIADYLKNKCDASYLKYLNTRLTELDTITNGLSPGARLNVKLPCAFLIDNSCSIYELRPLACRGGNSIDADLCRRHVEDMDSVNRDKEIHGSPYWIHAVPFQIMRALREGMMAGINKYKLGQEMLELTAATRIVLQNNSALENWIRGEDIFSGGKLNKTKV
jgi:Fe-S-cluster containining protein